MEDPELGFSLPFIQLGLSLFKRERNEKYMRHLKCRYRPTQKVAAHLLKFQTKRRLKMGDADLKEFLRRELKTGLPMAEFLEWSKANRVEGVPSLNDDVGAALLTDREETVGIVVFITSQRLIVYAEEADVESILWSLENKWKEKY